MGVRVSRIERQGAAVMGEGVLGPALRAEQVAEVAVRPGMVRPQDKRPLVMGRRLVQLAAVVERKGEIVVRVGVVRA